MRTATNMSDLDATLRRASAGDREALKDLVAAHLGNIEKFVRRRTGDQLLGKEPLDDLVQSAVREALAQLSNHDYQGPPAFEAWLYRIALTKIIARHRYHRAARRDVRREEPEAPGVQLADVCARFSSPSQAAMAKEMEAKFTAAFAQLPADHQQVFFLARVLELPHAEIARQIGRTEQASRNLLVRAAARLGALMGFDSGPPSA